jgi:peptide chain release factor 3
VPAARCADLDLVDKLDREGGDPFDLLDGIERSLALDVTPASRPAARGTIFSAPANRLEDAALKQVVDAIASPTRNCRGYCRMLRSPIARGG